MGSGSQKTALWEGRPQGQRTWNAFCQSFDGPTMIADLFSQTYARYELRTYFICFFCSLIVRFLYYALSFLFRHDLEQ
jgi:hypothetical protein